MKKKKLPYKDNGECYEVSAKMVMDAWIRDKTTKLVLVHGVIPKRGVVPEHGHAWVEDGDECIDNSTGKNIRMPRELYYALGEITVTKKYTADQTAKKLLKHKHYGHWDLNVKF